MFLDLQDKEKQQEYKRLLSAVGALSRLRSDSPSPYLGYREVENIFCKVFGAKNFARADYSVDAVKDKLGIGIKTFLNQNGRTLQKIAEFNEHSAFLRIGTPEEIIKKLSHLRNERIEMTKRICGLDSLIYHCVVRGASRIKVYECPMDEIDIKNIRELDIRVSESGAIKTIAFTDGKNEYSFNLSKSTLYKRFITENVLFDIEVEILEDPYEAIRNILNKMAAFAPVEQEKEYIFLPLFSDKGGRHVPEKSGLNQWNAGGRYRKPNEVYVPIPAWIHKKFPNFFPPREESFNLILPDGRVLDAKVCQDGGKALMSNPNTALGEWLLRTVMKLKEGELLTYSRLEELGVDSVIVYKEGENEEGKKLYSINFTDIGSYDLFYEENNGENNKK